VSFAAEFSALPFDSLLRNSLTTSVGGARESLARGKLSLTDFARLISPAAADLIEPLCRRSQQLTQQRFGRVIRLFAPLYLSNECINNCKYCGFSRDNPILRVTLSVEEARREARSLMAQGFRNILLVSGEHPKFVSSGYLADCVRGLHEEVPSVSLEVGPMDTEEYRPIVQAGADGLWCIRRLTTGRFMPTCTLAGRSGISSGGWKHPNGAYAAGFRRIGIGALYGLGDWRFEASVWRPCGLLVAPLLESSNDYFAASAAPLRGRVSAADPHHRPRAGSTGLRFQADVPGRRVGSFHARTGEAARWIGAAGITLMSAGSHTEPGGYTGAGREKLHHTERGRIVELGASEWPAPVRMSTRPANLTSPTTARRSKWPNDPQAGL